MTDAETLLGLAFAQAPASEANAAISRTREELDSAKLPRQTRAQVEEMARTTDILQQMKSLNVYEDWAAGKRGRK